MDEEHRGEDGRGQMRAGRWRRTWGLVALVAGVTVLSSVTTSVVGANHDFPDVPGTSPHHDDISWAVDHGIAQGFNDGTFRPTQAVSRQTMATFLRRLTAEFEFVFSSDPAGTGVAASHTTTCPPGKRPLAGGGHPSVANLFMTDSRPTFTDDGWFVRWETDNNVALGGGGVLTVYVLCAPGF